METADELDKQLQNGWERLIAQALPASREREKVRLMESVETGTGAVDMKRVYAIRAASGHKEWSILDPQRIAATIQTNMLSEMVGYFHCTTYDAIEGIMKHGLLPGSAVGRGRGDIPFTVFHPLDPRNTAAYKRVKRHQDRGTVMIVITLDTNTQES